MLWPRWKMAPRRWLSPPAAQPRLRCFSRLLLATTSSPDLTFFTARSSLLKSLMSNWGLTYSQVNMQDLGAIEKAITPQTRLIWVETPSNPLLGISDIAAIVSLAKKHNILVACDNTVATSMNQRPLQLGADITMHSVTKYISGHSDVLGGALVFREAGALFEKIQAIQREGGSVPSPFEAWLTLRGMQTFPYRMRAHSENAQRVAEFLSRHAKIEAVHYPGLPSHPGHQIAVRQMSAFGGLLSIQVKGSQADAFKVCAAVKDIHPCHQPGRNPQLH